jgi:hypothetical protein
MSRFHLVWRDVDTVVLQGDETILPVSKIELGRTSPEIEPLGVIEFPFLKQGVAAVNQINDRSREFLRRIVIGQNMEQTLPRRSMIDFDGFTLTASEANSIPNLKPAFAIRHC